MSAETCGKCMYFKDCQKLLHVAKERKACNNFQPRQSKYRNEKITIDGHTFPSQKEAQRYQELKLLQRAGQVVKIELQPVFELQPGFTKNGKKYRAITYIADFRVTYSDGHVEIEDTKGVKTKEFVIKHKLFEAKYPDLALKII